MEGSPSGRGQGTRAGSLNFTHCPVGRETEAGGRDEMCQGHTVNQGRRSAVASRIGHLGRPGAQDPLCLLPYTVLTRAAASTEVLPLHHPFQLPAPPPPRPSSGVSQPSPSSALRLQAPLFSLRVVSDPFCYLNNK